MVTKAVQTVSFFICLFLYADVNFFSNVVINTEYYFYLVTLPTKSKYFVFYSVNRQDPDCNSCEESSFSDEESKSDFEDFICPLSPGLKYPSDERVFVVYESKLRELQTSCAKCVFKINQNLIREGKNTGSQLILHTECDKSNFLRLVSILGKLLLIQKTVDIFVYI